MEKLSKQLRGKNKMKKTNLFTIIILLIVLTMAGVEAAVTSSSTSGTLDDSSAISISLINQDPDPAIAGDIVEVRLGIENIGGETVNDLIIELIPEYPFSLVSGQNAEIKVGTMNAYQKGDNMRIIKYEVRADREATAGSYELKIKYYEEDSVIATQKSLSVDIQSRESAEVIYIDQVELIPGKITPLKFTINNVGSAPLRDLSFQWENEDDIILPVGSDNTKYIKYIEVGGDKELNFEVIASANADPDLYKLDLTLTYDDPLTGEEKEINTKAGVYVGGATDFDVAFSGNSGGESSFSISNIGSVSASSVTVKIPDQTGWRVSGSNSVIIGNLNEGDYTIASFNLQQSNFGHADTQKVRGEDDKFQLPQQEDSKIVLEVIYTDSRGNRITVEKEVEVDSSAFMTTNEDGSKNTQMVGARGDRKSPSQQLWDTGRWVLLGIIILVTFVLSHKKYKKERLKDPNYTSKMLVKDILRKFRPKKTTNNKSKFKVKKITSRK